MSSRLLFPVTALLLVASCGDDKPSNDTQSQPVGAAADGKVGSSDPEAVIDSLNSAEWKEACLDIASAGNNRQLSQAPCKLLGLISSLAGVSCMESYQLCTESEGDVDCDAKPAVCTATLREADACNVASLRWLEEQTRDIDCSSSLSVLGTLDQNYVPPECEIVKQKCPDFVSSGSSSEDTGFGDF